MSIKITITLAILDEKWAESILKDHSSLARVPKLIIRRPKEMDKEKLHVKDKNGKCIPLLCPVCRDKLDEKAKIRELYKQLIGDEDEKL